MHDSPSRHRVTVAASEDNHYQQGGDLTTTEIHKDVFYSNYYSTSTSNEYFENINIGSTGTG
jgi:hypothetical protein